MGAGLDGVLAAAVAGVVAHPDVADTLDHLLTDSARLLRASALGLLVRARSGAPLELLAATSHRVAELELFQRQEDEGPCVEVLETGSVVGVSGQDELRARWGPVGPAIVAAGYHGVQAFPLRWRGLVLGGLNVFYPTPVMGDVGTGQVLADLAAVVVVGSSSGGPAGMERGLQQALAGRVVVEQAKGVLSYQHDVDVDVAFEVLRRQAEAAGTTLTATAEHVVTSPDSRAIAGRGGSSGWTS